MGLRCHARVEGLDLNHSPLLEAGKAPGIKTMEPQRRRPTSEVSSRYSRQRRTDTQPEMRLRSELHRRGLRFRLHRRVPGLPRRTVDLVFPRARLAVFVDGCFWHSCPTHGIHPKTNADWWTWKLARTVDRDHDTDRRLFELGWRVIRVWEHEDPIRAADKVETALRRLE